MSTDARRWRARALGISSACGFVWAGMSGCGDDGENVDAVCEEAERILRECSRRTEGVLDCGLLADEAYGECAIECLRSASCEEIEAQECDDASNAYATCLDTCLAPFFNFDCGDGERVSIDYRCDGEADCEDGRDELDCDVPEPMFACGGGENVPADYQCDGEADCENDADERDCPTFAEPICPGGF